MEHIIEANHGDTIIIKLPEGKRESNKPMPIKLQTSLFPRRSANEIINTICLATGIDIDTLKGPRGKSRVVNIRFYTAYRLRQMGLSFQLIGKKLDRDHVSAIHAVKTFKDRMQYQDEGTLAIVKKVEEYEKSTNKTNA